MKEKMADHNFAKPLKEAASYSFITSCDKVIISVPPKLKKIIPFSPFSDKRLGIISSYYRNGWRLREGLILNYKYFGLPANYLGKKIVADVEVERKITSSGGNFIQLIIYKLPDNTPAKYQIRIAPEAANSTGLNIPGSNLFLSFIKI